MLPEGIYTATAKTSQILETQTGTPYVSVPFAITSIDPPPSGEVKIWLTPKNRDQAKRQLVALGVSGRKVSTMDPSSAAYESLVGTEFPVRAKHTTYKDKPRVEFEIVAGNAPKSASIDRLNQLDDLFAEVPEPEAYEPADDDVPFS